SQRTEKSGVIWDVGRGGGHVTKARRKDETHSVTAVVAGCWRVRDNAVVCTGSDQWCAQSHGWGRRAYAGENARGEGHRAVLGTGTIDGGWRRDAACGRCDL